MARPREEGLLVFQRELVQLYDRFKADVEAFYKKHDVEINFWYSPSTIPQLKFIINGVRFEADELSEKDPTLLTNKLKHKARKATK